jgi:outer membrane protein assembly factor BamB
VTSSAVSRWSIKFLVLFLALSARAADWPTYQHDPEHTGRSDVQVDAAKLMLSWTAPDGYATPQIVGDTIYSTKPQGGFSGTRDDGTKWATYVSAFDLATGAIKWTHSGNNVFASPAAVGGGLVVFYGGTPCNGCSTPTPDANQLVVLDAATGALRYKVTIPTTDPQGELHTMPLLVPNPADGTVTAYCAGNGTLSNVLLGPTSGSVVWKVGAGGAGFLFTMPTLVGDAIAINGNSQLFAFDRFSGTPIPVNNDREGGGAKTAAYDAVRRNIYTPGIHGLAAFRYVNNTQIEFLWHRPGGGETGIGNGSIAIGANGKVYVPSSGNSFFELDPDTGATLRSVPAPLDGSVAPSITAGLLWLPSAGCSRVYNLDTLDLVRTLPGYSNSTAYPGAGAFTNAYFAMGRGDTVFAPGFQVWARPTARPLNISTRLRAQSSAGKELFAGFIIAGSDPKQVCIRALGPSLQQFGISDTLPDPTIELHDSFGIIQTNNNWKDTQASEIQLSGLAPSYDSEAAMIIKLNPGSYTAIVRDANGGAGVGLLEVYDRDTGAPVKLANISTRGFVETAENVMIAGFILGNEDLPALVVIRAIGPSLAKFGSGWLPDPVLELHDANGGLIRSNDNWRDTQEAEIKAAGLAPENNAESAIIATLPPSPYTAIVAGKNGSTGIGVVEIYHVR